MATIEKALDYIVAVVTENDEVKKFPKDFVTASMQWVRSWFLIDDPKMEAKLKDPHRSIESKKTIIESKLEDLSENPTFAQELAERLATLEQHRAHQKNRIVDTNIDVKGHAHIGDKGFSPGDSYNEKNIIKSSTIQAGGDFRVGDDVVIGNQHVQIIHNYSGHQKQKEAASAAGLSLKATLKTLLAKGELEKAIEQLLGYSENEDETLNSMALLLSARNTRINKQEHAGTASHQEANLERNRISAALTALIEELGE